MKFRVIQGCRGEFPIDLLCSVFGVSKAGFYAWKRRQREPSEKTTRRQRLCKAIEAIHLGSKKNLGSPRLQGITAGLGYDESPRTIARLMQEMKLRSRLKRKFKITTDSNHKLPIAPNHLMQDFKAYAPNQIWMSDLTYVRTRQGWLYVCAIIDLYSRHIVGWAASSRMTTDLVMQAYLRACRDRRPGRDLIFHSDRGSQFASQAFRKILAKHGHIQSMSRRGNCWDSAPIESFWHTLKTELVYWESYRTREQALLSIRAWIDGDYNPYRPHSSLGNLSPKQFERKGMTMRVRTV